MLQIMTRIILILVVVGVSFASGYYFRTPETITQTKTKVVEKEKVITKKVVVRQTDADGKTTEKITEETTTDKASNKKEDEKLPPVTPTHIPNNWAVGMTTDFSRDKPYIPTGASVDYRLFGDLWVTGHIDWNEPEFKAGIKLEF